MAIIFFEINKNNTFLGVFLQFIQLLFEFVPLDVSALSMFRKSLDKNLIFLRRITLLQESLETFAFGANICPQLSPHAMSGSQFTK